MQDGVTELFFPPSLLILRLRQHPFMSRMELRPLVMCFALCVVYATSKPTEKKDRVHHDEPLSNLEHDDADNFDYDHEAFLGQEEAKSFDQLTPEESKERLG